MTTVKLKTIKQLTGQICLQTGLHIGAGDSEIHIGGTDSSVVKHPKTLHPYIPGSSLKGKIRSLLELYFGLINFESDTGKPVSYETYVKSGLNDEDKKNILNIIKLFGAGAESIPEELSGEILISRLIFSDCFISKESENEILTEVKAENSIDRRTSTASNPRFIERVPKGIKFDFALSVKEFEGDDTEILTNCLTKGLRLLELDALGGSGSRGYGKIKFENLKLDGTVFELPQQLA